MKITLQLIAVIVLFVLSVSFLPKSNDNFPAELVGIEYYSKCNCSEKSPIFVRIKYKTNIKNAGKLRMEHKFSGGMRIIVAVTEKDKTNNILYSYCSQEGNQKEFETTFISEQGVRSNPVKVKVLPDKSDIIVGSAPKTIKIN